jgi:hypothetical protein
MIPGIRSSFMLRAQNQAKSCFSRGIDLVAFRSHESKLQRTPLGGGFYSLSEATLRKLISHRNF